ncbi:hypothetical protein N7475_003024 [Penicillium sp. IBT 31633x]|nr:hypothetical protein N7475_003024 [Penicillium sp. IBT 31633x]
METILRRVTSVLFDVVHHINTYPSQKNKVANILTNVPDLNVSFSPISQSKAMDPFLRLPWFALEDILLQLPDLPTLHQLYKASPAIASYLEHSPSFFSKLVEHVAQYWEPTSGLAPQTMKYLRILVYLWWKEDDASGGTFPEQNPLQDHFYMISSILGPPRHNLPDFTMQLGDYMLPHYTPSKFLRRLLSLSSQLHRDAHAFFHSCMKLCLSSRLERPANQKMPWPKNGSRPRGIRVDTDLGGEDAPSWQEEQRLIQAFLRRRLFCEVRRVVVDERLPYPSLVPQLPIYPYTVDLGLCALNEDSVTVFWELKLEKKSPEMEQLATVVAWIQKGRPLHGATPSSGTHFSTCCPSLTPLKPSERGLYDDIHVPPPPGCFWAQDCTVVPQSGVLGAGVAGRFRKFGVSFWDKGRMISLGLLLPRQDRYVDRKELAFRWSCLLYPPNDEVIRFSRRRPGPRVFDGAN